MLAGKVEVHTEFYDTIVLGEGESVYIDSNMGHAYVAAEGCDEAVLLGVCSSADEQLMESLLKLHGDDAPTLGMVRAVEPANSAEPRPRARKSRAR